MDRDGLVTVPEAAPRGRAPAHGWGRNSFRALRSHPFRLYFCGQVISARGTLLQQTAIGWLVLRLTGSASSLGLVLAAGGLPSLILGPWGGSIADRDNLRKLLIVTQSIFGVLAIALWILASEGSTSVRVIVAINMIGGFV